MGTFNHLGKSSRYRKRLDREDLGKDGFSIMTRNCKRTVPQLQPLRHRGLGLLPRPWPHQSPFYDTTAAIVASWCDVDADQSLTDGVSDAGGIHFQIFRQLVHRPWAMAQAAPDLMAQMVIFHQVFCFRLREYSWATTLRPANCAPTYRATVCDDFQRPTAWSWGMVAPASARSTAMPTRQLWPL